MRRVLTRTMLALILASTLGTAPGQQTSGSMAMAKPAPVKKTKVEKPYQIGKASWYGTQFQGKETASGEAYDMFRFTAAHLGLPLGSWVRVTNLRNRKSVIVRINDRGPVTPGRIIDLSYGAAQVLEFRHKGLEKVQLDVIQVPETAGTMVAMAQN